MKNPEEQENRMNETNENQDAENDDSENQKLKAKLESSENQITDMTKKISDYEDLLKRKQAEFENYRKRTLREKDDFQKSANQKFLEELLPIVDNFEKAIASSSDNSDKTTIMDGLLLIEKQLKKLLETHGVEVIQSVGEEFDPNLHEAIQMEEGKDEYVSDTVIKEWQKGYLLNEKV
ncbi:MAG: nucleotide exchange factor GrpE, partial [Spirochaetota bacterium]|nr:nucleotide exchange factor GrpE [Spirochaetota bacterium]